MKTSLVFRSHYFIENLQLKRKSTKEQRKKKRVVDYAKKTKRSFLGGFLLTFNQSDCPVRLLRNMAKKHSGFWSKKSFTLYAIVWFEE